jgi:hypothetical protein
LAVSLCGCATIKHWGRVIAIETHEGLDDYFGDGVKPVSTTPSTVKPDPTVRYNSGTPSDGGSDYEIWTLWHGMNIRVHTNPGELRGIVPLAGRWYPLNMAIMPADIVTLTRTATGATIEAKDFRAPSGQRYRIEAIRADRIGTIDRVRRLELPESKFGGAILIWYATIE